MSSDGENSDFDPDDDWYPLPKPATPKDATDGWSLLRAVLCKQDATLVRTLIEGPEAANPKQRWVCGADENSELTKAGKSGNTLLEIALARKVKADVITVLQQHLS